jgi:hypothetical protein
MPLEPRLEPEVQGTIPKLSGHNALTARPYLE